MRIISRYIAVEFAKMLGWFILSFVVIYLVIDMSRIEGFLHHKAQAGDIVGYYIYKLPLIVFQMAPVAVLLATSITLAAFGRNNELVAFRAAGISLWRIIGPILAAAALVSVLSFLCAEYIIPVTSRQQEYIERIKIKGKEPKGYLKSGDLWFRGKENTFYNIRVFEPRQKLFRQLSIFKFDQDFRLQYRLDAERMEWREDGWRLFDLVIRTAVYQENNSLGDGFQSYGPPLLSKPQFLPEKIMPELKETPKDFLEQGTKPEIMGFRELQNYIAELSRRRHNVDRYLVDLYAKLAIPAISLVMAIIGVPFSLRFNRQGGRAIGLGVSMLLGFCYWVLLALGLALGHGGRLAPLWAAWGANILFLLGGGYLLAKVNQS